MIKMTLLDRLMKQVSKEMDERLSILAPKIDESNKLLGQTLPKIDESNKLLGQILAELKKER